MLCPPATTRHHVPDQVTMPARELEGSDGDALAMVCMSPLTAPFEPELPSKGVFIPESDDPALSFGELPFCFLGATLQESAKVPSFEGLMLPVHERPVCLGFGKLSSRFPHVKFSPLRAQKRPHDKKRKLINKFKPAAGANAHQASENTRKNFLQWMRLREPFAVVETESNAARKVSPEEAIKSPQKRASSSRHKIVF